MDDLKLLSEAGPSVLLAGIAASVIWAIRKYIPILVDAHTAFLTQLQAHHVKYEESLQRLRLALLSHVEGHQALADCLSQECGDKVRAYSSLSTQILKDEKSHA